jgi:Fic family protein
MKCFDYSFLENGMFPAKFTNIVGNIYELRERINEFKRQKRFEKNFTYLENTAKIQSVKYSNIDNIEVTGERIHAIVNQNSKPTNFNKSEIKAAGYWDVLTMIHNEYSNLDICEKDILQIHKILWTYSSVDGCGYKEKENIANSEGYMQKKDVRNEIVEAMEHLILAYTETRNNCNINQLLLIPCFILDFLCISPFDRENDMMSRLFALLLLCKNGFDAVRYISFEEQINRSQIMYHQALTDGLAEQENGENNYVPFIEYFIVTVLSCYNELDNHFPKTNSNRITKKQQIEETVLNSSEPISKREICRILPDISPTTVESALTEMVNSGRIEKVGIAQNTKYIKSDSAGLK